MIWSPNNPLERMFCGQLAQFSLAPSSLVSLQTAMYVQGITFQRAVVQDFWMTQALSTCSEDVRRLRKKLKLDSVDNCEDEKDRVGPKRKRAKAARVRKSITP